MCLRLPASVPLCVCVCVPYRPISEALYRHTDEYQYLHTYADSKGKRYRTLYLVDLANMEQKNAATGEKNDLRCSFALAC